MNDRNIAIHEAAHVVIGWYFGMVPTSASFATDSTGPQAVLDRTAFNASVPGSGSIQGLVNSAISVVQHAAGGCAELRLGTEHEDCGWGGDYARFRPLLNALSRICGYTYDHCWDVTSAMAKEILAEAEIWSAVEDVASALEQKRVLDENDLAAILSGRTRPKREERVATLERFVTTIQALAVSATYDNAPRSV